MKVASRDLPPSRIITQITIVLLIIATSDAITCPASSASLANCEVCTLASGNIVCTSCKSAYYLTLSSTCALCSSVVAGCISCTISGTSLPTCNACDSNTALYNGVCQTCNQIAGCSNCSTSQNSLICMSCSAGYLLY